MSFFDRQKGAATGPSGALGREMLVLERLVAAAPVEQANAMRGLCLQIASALADFSKLSPDGGDDSPIAKQLISVLMSMATMWRPGRGFAALKPNMLAALPWCPHLADVHAAFLARLEPPK